MFHVLKFQAAILVALSLDADATRRSKGDGIDFSLLLTAFPVEYSGGSPKISPYTVAHISSNSLSHLGLESSRSAPT